MKKAKKSVYEIITEQIINKLEQGVVPWHCPWNKHDMNPTNLISNKSYNGLNIFLLAMQGYESQYWLSYKQAKSVGGNVKKGEKVSILTFWNINESKDKEGEKKEYAILKYYRVFNIEQCENIDHKRVEEERKKIENFEVIDFSPIVSAESIASSYKKSPEVKHQGQRACYNKVSDLILMPNKNTFHNEQEYYSTLFHEMGHSTGHKNRLNRDTLENFAAFGDPVYSKEELVAEFCASFLSAEAGILNHTVENSAAYIKGWSKKLRSNPKIIIEASRYGRHAAEYILGARGGEA